MTAPPPARTLDFGASATASLLVKMAITFGISKRRDAPSSNNILFDKSRHNLFPPLRKKRLEPYHMSEGVERYQNVQRLSVFNMPICRAADRTDQVDAKLVHSLGVSPPS